MTGGTSGCMGQRFFPRQVQRSKSFVSPLLRASARLRLGGGPGSFCRLLPAPGKRGCPGAGCRQSPGGPVRRLLKGRYCLLTGSRYCLLTGKHNTEISSSSEGQQKLKSQLKLRLSAPWQPPATLATQTRNGRCATSPCGPACISR